MGDFISYQDFLQVKDKQSFIAEAINWHTNTRDYKIAIDAELYDRQLNVFINSFARKILTGSGTPINDPASTFKPIASNYFHELNTERNMYSLGYGLTFNKGETKQKLGANIDQVIQEAGIIALEQGQAFVLYNLDRCYVFPLTHFVPLKDEETSQLMAGIRFWQIADNKPMYAVLYEPDGYTKYRNDKSSRGFVEIESKRGYKVKISKTRAFGSVVEGYENYPTLPIVPLYGDKNAQSTLVGMKQAIDNYDLIQSGFADNVANCQQVYWIIDNCGGMDDADLAKARENLLFRKMMTVDASDGVKITPYNLPIPTDAHEAALASLHQRIYRDFGAVDVNNISAAAKTATEINAAYSPMDLRADAYEYQLIECIIKLLALVGVTGDDAVPSFKRNRIANEGEQTDMILAAANYLDDETVLNKLPFITPDEVDSILKRKDAEESDRYTVDNDSAGDVANAAEAVDSAEDAVGKTLNGAQTQSLIAIMGQLAAGSLTEGQAVALVSTAIGVSKDEARAIIRGE